MPSLKQRKERKKKKKNQTRATVPEPRGPQEPRGVPTLMEVWASLERIAWWGQMYTATTALLLQTPSSTLTDKHRHQNTFPSSYFSDSRRLELGEYHKNKFKLLKADKNKCTLKTDTVRRQTTRLKQRPKEHGFGKYGDALTESRNKDP